MKTICFVDNLYFTPKGHSYMVRDVINALTEKGYELHMYKIGLHKPQMEFTQPKTIKSYNGYEVPEEEFKSWLKEKKPEYCIFFEYNQWFPITHDKVAICKEMGIKTIGFLMWEKLDWNKVDHYRLYTKLAAPTMFQTKLMRKNGAYNTVHVPWGTDIGELDEISDPPRSDKVVFYHCAGSGGVGNRKNTQVVIDAYKLIEDDNTELKISHLGAKVFSRKEIISFTKYADVLVNVSKWDTMGLNTFEANACGKPAIVANAPPMNEIVKDNVNGLLVNGEESTEPQVTCPAYLVNIDELSRKMMICKNKLILKTLQNNSRKFAETNFDWNKNKKELLKLFQ